jgi:hypothetical protein
MLLFLATSNTNAQVKSVMIEGFYYGDYSILTINPNNEKVENEYKYKKDKDFHITLKEELDKWLLQGYDIIDSSIASTSAGAYKIIYILVKKE